MEVGGGRNPQLLQRTVAFCWSVSVVVVEVEVFLLDLGMTGKRTRS